MFKRKVEVELEFWTMPVERAVSDGDDLLDHDVGLLRGGHFVRLSFG